MANVYLVCVEPAHPFFVAVGPKVVACVWGHRGCSWSMQSRVTIIFYHLGDNIELQFFYLNRVHSFWGSRWRPTTRSKSPLPDQRSCPRRRHKVPVVEILWKIRREKSGTSVVIVASVGPATFSHSATAIQLPIPHIPTPRWTLSRADFVPRVHSVNSIREGVKKNEFIWDFVPNYG